MNLDSNSDLFADTIQAVSAYYGIIPVYIEKDYWISKMLQALARSRYANRAVFKGGTSLSKAYGLIDRFSEDIDIAVITEDASGNQVKKLITALSKEMSVGLQEQEIPGKTSKGSRYRKMFYQYPALVKNTINSYASNQVVVEINSFANPFPYGQHRISSYIAAYLEDKGLAAMMEEFDLTPFELNVLDKTQTLCEKVVSLLRFSFFDDPVKGLSEKIRHFYDLYFLLKDNDCKIYVCGNIFVSDLQELLDKDREQFDNPVRWKTASVKESPLIGSFDTLWDRLYPVYERGLDVFAFGEIPSKEDVRCELEDLLRRVELNCH